MFLWLGDETQTELASRGATLRPGDRPSGSLRGTLRRVDPRVSSPDGGLTALPSTGSAEPFRGDLVNLYWTS